MARSRAMTVYSPPRPAPITIRVPRAPAARPSRRRRGRSRGRRGGGAGIMSMAVGGAVVGFVEKSEVLKDVPSLPMVGKKGTIAIIAYVWARHGGGGNLAWDVAKAAAALAGYQFGKEGKIEGHYDEDWE